MREVHPDFKKHLLFKDEKLLELYLKLREFVLSINPHTNELLYHTHALTSLYSISKKMSDGYCMIVIYEKHLNLAFNRGRFLNDPSKLLKGSGKFMRHIRINDFGEIQSEEISNLIKNALELAIYDTDAKNLNQGLTISKIKN